MFFYAVIGNAALLHRRGVFPIPDGPFSAYYLGPFLGASQMIIIVTLVIYYWIHYDTVS